MNVFNMLFPQIYIAKLLVRAKMYISIWCCKSVFRVFAEETNSFAATERSFTIKMFTFQFFTLFSSLFYVAFFLGRYCVSAEGQLLIYIGEDFLKETVLCILPAQIIFFFQI